jgi:hypothetical protein
MDRDVLDVIEREIDQEARARFPGSAVRQAVNRLAWKRWTS